MSTLTTTSSLTYASTQTATTTLGSNATITTAGSSDSLYETGNDSVVSDVGSGTRVRTINYGGSDGNSSTFTTTYSSYDSSNRTSPSPTCLKAAVAWSEKSSTIATTDRAN